MTTSSKKERVQSSPKQAVAYDAVLKVSDDRQVCKGGARRRRKMGSSRYD